MAHSTARRRRWSSVSRSGRLVELGPQRAVLLKERGEGLSLALVEPGASGHVEPAQGHRIDHVAEDSRKAPILGFGRIMGHDGFEVHPPGRE